MVGEDRAGECLNLGDAGAGSARGSGFIRIPLSAVKRTAELREAKRRA